MNTTLAQQCSRMRWSETENLNSAACNVQSRTVGSRVSEALCAVSGARVKILVSDSSPETFPGCTNVATISQRQSTSCLLNRFEGIRLLILCTPKQSDAEIENHYDWRCCLANFGMDLQPFQCIAFRLQCMWPQRLGSCTRDRKLEGKFLMG